MFGQPKPVFGASTSSGFGFGNTQFGATTSQPSTGLFGQPATNNQPSMFGGSVFGGAAAPVQGTTVKFNAPLVNDTVQKNGQKVQVNAKHMCITAMKEYADKSIEELRVEDYLQNRKSGSADGNKSIFGATASTGFGFGATQTTSSSLFGSTASAQTTQASIFGGAVNTGSIFGSTHQQPPPLSSFGQTTQNSIFGAKPLFGSAAPTASPLNLTGNQPAQTGFGFGQNNPGSIFGNTQSSFGAPAATTASSFGLFGAQPTSTAAGGFGFGKPAGTSIFGSAATTTTHSLFGATQPTAQASPFGAPAASQTSSIFGGVKPTGTSLFGSAPVATTASAFGASTFGTGFGAKTTTSSLFGAAPAATNTAFGLGTSTNSTLQTGLGTGLFGAKKPSPFGAPASSAAPAFGFGAATATSTAAAPGGTGLFGNTTGFGLGAAAQPAQPTTGSIFGSTGTGAPTGGLSLFNKPTGTGFGFGQTTTSAPSLFGSASSAQPAAGTSNLFGNTAAVGGTSAFGFGAAATAGTGSPFGATAAAANPATMSPFVEQLTQQSRAQQHVLELMRSMPYGQSSLFRYLNADLPTSSTAATSTTESTAVSTTTAAKASAAAGGSVLSASAAANNLAELHRTNSLALGRSPSTLVSRRPVQTVTLNRKQLFTGFQEEEALSSTQSPLTGKTRNSNSSTTTTDGALSRTVESTFFVRRDDWKRLNIPNCVRNSIIERSSLAASDLEKPIDEREELEGPQSVVTSASKSQRPGRGAGDVAVPKVQFVDSPTSTPIANRKSTTADAQDGDSKQSSLVSSRVATSPSDFSQDANWTLPADVTLNQTALPEDGSTAGSDERPTSTTNKAGVKLSKEGYYMFPTMDELDGLTDENGRCVVQDLVIGRQSYGHILFPGLTDITGIDFDEVVHIRRREVVVYPDDNTKPPEGYGLNRNAEITLDGVWPTDKSTREPIKSPQRIAAIRFDERLETATRKMDASFIEYRPDTGSWVFEVKHFSKYRLEESDQEDGEQQEDGQITMNGTTGKPGPITNGNAATSLGQLAKSKDYQKDVSMEGFEQETSSQLLYQLHLPPRSFRGLKDSFVTNARFGIVSAEMEVEDEDDEATDFLSRRSRIGLPFQAPSFQANKNQHLESLVNQGLYGVEDVVQEKHFQAKLDDAVQKLMKFEALQTVHCPIPRDPLPVAKPETASGASLPFRRIAKMIGGVDLRGNYLDSGLCRGDAARISWVFLRKPDHFPHLALLTADPSSDPPVTVVASSVPSVVDPQDEVLLNAALQTSVQTPTAESDGSSCPHFYPATGPRVLDSYLACCPITIETGEDIPKLSPRMRAFSRALLLCQSLWAAHDTSEDGQGLGLHGAFMPRRKPSPEGEEMDEGTESSVSATTVLNDLARRQAVSEWIRSELRPWLDWRLQELGLSHMLEDTSQPFWQGAGDSKTALYAGIFACLCCGEPALACRLALSAKMSHLASCLSMAAVSDPLCKSGLQKQLRVWNELKVLPYMPRHILRTYAVLAGEIKVSVVGGKGKMVVNVLAGVPYLQALGIHLWYLVDHSTDLATVLKLFSKNWHACATFEVAPPRPPKDEELMGHSGAGDAPSREMLSRSSPRDICYHLLRLASRPWHSLERTLDPQSIRCGRRSQPADGQLAACESNWPSAWHLWRVLVAFSTNAGTSLNPLASSRLHAEMAAHLEAAGLWEWAVFALLHEADPVVRAAAVKQLVGRHVVLRRPLKSEEGQWRLDGESLGRLDRAETFIVETFGVPVKWLHEAKACLARSLMASQPSGSEMCMMLATLEAGHWFMAGHLETAHEVCLKQLLPEVMLRSQSGSTTMAPYSVASEDSASLAARLFTVLQPFSTIPPENFPAAFDTGAGVYLVYAQIMHLAQQLALRQKREDGEVSGNDDVVMGSASDAVSSEILGEMQIKAQRLVELLQSMPTPTVRERVVKSELAVTVIRLISAFLNDTPLQQQQRNSCITSFLNAGSSVTTPVDEKCQILRRKVQLIASIDSSSGPALAELESLTASAISQCIF